MEDDRAALLLNISELTGLHNWRFCEMELERLDTPQNLPIAIVIADVNNMYLPRSGTGSRQCAEQTWQLTGIRIAGQASEGDKMATVTVFPGICGLKTRLTATADEDQMVSIQIESECPHITALQDELVELDGYGECFARYSTSTVYAAAEKHVRHLACPVPTAILKGMEVACGLALPKDVTLTIVK